MEQTYFRKGFGLKREIEATLSADYHSQLVDRIRAEGHTLQAGDMTFRVAKEFGFCYGVDRAVEYAYESRRKFPDRRIFLVGEIIHNPHVNEKLESMGIIILRPEQENRYVARRSIPVPSFHDPLQPVDVDQHREQERWGPPFHSRICSPGRRNVVSGSSSGP